MIWRTNREIKLKTMSIVEATRRTAIQFVWATISSTILLFVPSVGQALALRLSAVNLNDTDVALKGYPRRD